ncbi:MAG: 4Fe-4S dicluster domain-containing protein [Candidatus Bathyarchaeia archaeon]|nr:4Fe-4S dicluster domain-containing protein [Candidatus Bathyarchaeota archaeon]
MGKNIWIARDYLKCSGCRKCEIACSLFHEGKIWPEASRIRIFMLFPGLEVPHLCTQCDNYPCVNSCKFNALSINEKTGAVIVNKEACTACGVCINACPGKVPWLHPKEKYVLICDLCGGNPKCVEECHEGGWDALKIIPKTVLGFERKNYKLYAREPEDVTKELAKVIYGEEVS